MVRRSTIVSVVLASVVFLLYAEYSPSFFFSHLPSSSVGTDILYFIWFMGLATPVILVLVFVTTQKPEALPAPFVEPELPVEHPLDVPELPESAWKMFDTAKQGLSDDSTEALRKGIKIGLTLAAKGGVEYSVTATDSTQVTVDGLTIKISGTGKPIPTEDMVRITG